MIAVITINSIFALIVNRLCLETFSVSNVRPHMNFLLKRDRDSNLGDESVGDGDDHEWHEVLQQHRHQHVGVPHLVRNPGRNKSRNRFVYRTWTFTL